MMLMNGKTQTIEPGVPGCPDIGHLAIHAACDRWLASRGLPTGSPFLDQSAAAGSDSAEAAT
jgi:hypothetical protein